MSEGLAGIDWQKMAGDVTAANAEQWAATAAGAYLASPNRWPEMAAFAAALSQLPGCGWPLWKVLLASGDIKPRFAALHALGKWKRESLLPEMRPMIVPILADMRHQASRGKAADLLDRIPRE